MVANHYMLSCHAKWHSRRMAQASVDRTISKMGSPWHSDLPPGTYSKPPPPNVSGQILGSPLPSDPCCHI